LKAVTIPNKYLERFFEWIYYKSGKIEKSKLNFDNFKISIISSIRVFADFESFIEIFYYILESAVLLSECKNKITANCELEEKLKHAEIIIKDGDIGIPENQFETLFKITEDIVVNSTSKTRGSGLGQDSSQRASGFK